MCPKLDNKQLHMFFKEELEKAGKLLDLPVARRTPRKIIAKDFPVEHGYYSGVRYTENGVEVSRKLNGELVSFILRREAYRQFIPYRWDQVPQYSDVVWAYAYYYGTCKDMIERWWMESSMPASIPLFPPYHGVNIMKSLIAAGGIDAIVSCTKLLRRFAEILPTVDFKVYYEILSNFQSHLTYSLSRSEEKILNLISRHHDIRVKEIIKKSGLSKSTVYRCIDKLKTMNIITGFLNVNFRKIGLISLLLTVEDHSTNYIKVFAEFPFTYRIFQLASANPAFVSILLPYEYTQKLQAIIGKYEKLKLSTIVRQSYNILTENVKPEHVLLRMSERYYSHLPLVPRPKLEDSYYKPSLNELRLINVIHTTGDSSPLRLSERLGIGYWTVRSMLRKLQHENVLYNVVFPTGIALGDPSVILIHEKEENFNNIATTFSTVSTALLTYIRGQIDGIWGILYTKPRLTRAVIKASRLLLKDKIRILQPVISAESSSWQVPLNLYDGRSKTFIIDRELEKLDASLEEATISSAS